MANKKHRKKPLSPEQLRRRNAARARLASYLGAFTLCISLIIVVSIGGKTDEPLQIIADDYDCLASAEDDLTVIEKDDTAVAVVDAKPEQEIKIDPAIIEISHINPKLKDTYPIDMIIRSEYAIVYDVEADEVLYAKNAEEKCFPASTTKILSSAVILNNVEEDFVFTVGDELDMVNPGSSLAMLSKGQQLDTGMIVDGLMLPSGNDAAYCAAANVGRVLGNSETLSPETAVQNFVDEMNRTAKLLGCENTHFANPDGFHDDNHYTTVKDMIKITLYAEKFDRLMQAVSTPYEDVTLLTGEVCSWENNNKLIHEYSDCYYMYATGMKTGMTDEAGYCVVATAERFDHQLICIVFGAEASDIRWNDTIALLDAGFEKKKKNLDQ